MGSFPASLRGVRESLYDLLERFKQWLSELRHHESQLFLVLSLIIGATVGAIVVAFIVLTENLGARLYPPGGNGWRRLFLPIIGSLVTGALLSRYFPDARGSGIPQTKVALFLRGGRIRLKTVLGRFFCSSAALASGLALGREGPSVQIGAGLSSVIGRWLGFGPEKVQALIPVGAAAALAAAFNTPIAAVLFSLEEIMGDLHAPLLGSVVLSAATSWVVLHLFLGDEPLFHVPSYQLNHPGEFIAYAALGLAGGLCSVAFVKLTLYLRLKFRLLPKSTIWCQPAIGGVVVGILGFFVPEVLGVGYGFVSQVLSGNFVLATVAMLIVLKLVATAACYASGNTGGIFGPSLFLGAMIGASMGSVIHHWLPLHTATPGAYALVGMGATFAGIIRTPLTSVFMIFELTRDYSIVVPLMIANLISFYVSYRFQEKPIYEALTEQDGIHLPNPETARSRRIKTVSEVMQAAPEFESPEQYLEYLAPHPRGGAYLIGTDDHFLGLLRMVDVQASRQQHEPPVAGDLMLTGHSLPHVHTDHPIDVALERMGASHVSMLPVLDRADLHLLRGVVLADDVLRSYGVPAAGMEALEGEDLLKSGS